MTDAIVEALQNTTTLARITTKSLGVNRTDRAASRQVATDHHAAEGAARVLVSRLAGAEEHHRAIISAQVDARNVLKSISMPWGNDDGWRILPNANFERFVREFQKANNDFKGAMEKLRADADNVVARAKQNIGTLSVPVPTVDELLSAYALDFTLQDYPQGKFSGLPEATARKLNQRMEKQVAAAFEQAQLDTLKRFLSPLSNFIERMDTYSERERSRAAGQEVGKTGIFRDTVVTNIKDLYDVLGSFNIVGDERLVELTNKLASLATVEPDVLRDNTEVRAAATERAREVMSNLNSWLAPAAPQQQAA